MIYQSKAKIRVRKKYKFNVTEISAKNLVEKYNWAFFLLGFTLQKGKEEMVVE